MVKCTSKIEKLTHVVNQQTSDVTTAITAILKQFQATPPPASVKAVEETCVTCGGAHPYYQYLATDGNSFPELKDNIQGHVSAAAVNYNQGNPDYRPPGMANQIRPPCFAQPNVQNNQNQFSPPQGFNRGNNFNPEHSYQAPAKQNQNVYLNELEKVRRMNEANMKAMQTQIDMVKNELRNEMKNSIQTSLSNQTNEIKNMMASNLQMNIASTSGSGSLPSNIVANPKVDERVEEIFTDPDLAEYTIKKLGLPELNSTRMTLELANRVICTPAGIARDFFILGGKFTFLADFVIVDYKSDPKVSLILGRPFLRTARALIDVHGEEMILHDGDERSILNMRHDTSSYSNQPQRESINVINVFNNSSKDSSLKDSINLANHTDNVVDSVPEMFTDEHALDYSSPLIFDEYDDDFLEVKSDDENVYDDPFDFNREKIKEVDALPSTNNEDKTFNPGILIQEKYFEFITHVIQDKKLVSSNASSMLEDFDPPFYEPLFFKEVSSSKMLLPFSSENEEKVFKPGVHTFEKVHSSFIPELSHPSYKIFRINQIFKSPMKIFLFSCGKDTHILVVPCIHFYPLINSSMGELGQAK
uniref:Reverse transcriptase domain-containing protein n=1 Tax=Tanacetum cinerariifolium TaxID=118510 RepID=A0A6L2LM50_TANCI|nr:reverse transcriptase domain-containing protein [Tanacetum cinerariifolium]